MEAIHYSIRNNERQKTNKVWIGSLRVAFLVFNKPIQLKSPLNYIFCLFLLILLSSKKSPRIRQSNGNIKYTTMGKISNKLFILGFTASLINFSHWIQVPFNLIKIFIPVFSMLAFMYRKRARISKSLTAGLASVWLFS